MGKLNTLTLRILFLFQIFGFLSPAQTTCATALSAPINGPCITTSTVNDATQNAPNLNASCGTVSFRHERWYTFTVSGGPLNVTIVAQSADRNLYLQLISSTASCTGLSQIACANADTNNNTPQTEFINQLLPNGIYYLKVVNVGGGSSMTLNSLCITAPPNACSSITTITSCGTATTVTIPAGAGMYNSFACGYGTTGPEKIVSFTPSVTGNYSIEQLGSTDVVNYQFKPASNGCNGNNWLCIGDLFDASTSNSFVLTGGVTYYFMLDTYTDIGDTVNFMITCSTPLLFNDECLNATTILANSLNNCTYTLSGTTIGATNSQPECTGTADDDVWYTFQATSSTHILTVTPGTLNNAVFEVFDGSCDFGLTSIACQDLTTSSSPETLTITGLNIGVYYYVRIHSFNSASGQGTFTFCVSSPPNPCSSVTTVATCGVPINQTVVAGNGRYLTYACGVETPGIEYIYAFTPPQNGFYYIQMNSSTIAVDFQYKDASLGCDEYSWNCLSSSIPNNSLSPYMDLLGGVTYYIMLDPQVVVGGIVNFTIGCRVATPTNDNCDNADNVPVNPTAVCAASLNGTSVGAEESAPACSGSTDDDVWYQFAATSDTHIVTITPNTMVNAAFEVFLDDCADLQSIGCFDSTIDKDIEFGLLQGLTIGDNYIVRVYSSEFGFGFGSFNICVTTPPNPCDSIIPIAACDTPISLTIPSGIGSYYASYCGTYTDGIETIYMFTPTDSGYYTIQQNSSTGTISYQYKEEFWGCDMNFWSCAGELTGTETSPYFYLDAGINYYFLLDPLVSSGDAVNFQITCGVIPPANDDPCGALLLDTLDSVCNYNTFSNTNASNTYWITPPSCGNYVNNDVWFYTQVPVTGLVNIDTQAIQMTNGGMAVYTGDCFSLVEIACDDNSSANANMPFITVSGLTPGTFIYIRVWENGGGASGDFGICTTTLPFCDPPTGQPSNLVLTTTGSTTVNGSFVPIVGATGYLVIQSTTATPPSTPQPGIVYDATTIATLGPNLTFVQAGPSTSFSVTGLIGNTRYYYYVYAYYNATDCAGPVYALDAATSNSAVTCVDVPNTVEVTSTTLNSFTLDWFLPIGGNANPIIYTIDISTNATFTALVAGSPFVVNNPTTLLNVTGLNPNTIYYYRIKATAGSCSSAYVTGSTFTGYCLSGSTSATRYIDSFATTGGTTNISNVGSGYSTGGYGDFTSQLVSKSLYGTLSFNAQFFNGTYAYGFNIWVDWNDDLDFNDAGEKVYASGTLVTSATGSFLIPGNAALGQHRMRIKADINSPNPNPCGTLINGETEDYTIEVLPLACSANPSQVSFLFSGPNSAVVSWTPASPVPTNGYQYYYSTSANPPLYTTFPSGSTVSSQTSVVLNGLVPSFTYYFWVRSNCSIADGSGAWIGPIAISYSACTPGNSQGTSSAGCPTVVSGGLNLNGQDPLPVGGCGTSGCTTLEATYLPLGDTSNYTVQSIPYNPPYQFGCLQNPVSINIDDVWSPVINLPFNFCFYGNNYNKCIISSNGAISFDISTNVPGGYSSWSFASSIPSTILFKNTIFGVYQDIHPGLGGQIGWELITLDTGCRALVASFRNVPMYSCSSLLYTGMIVLYENTNVIEVYVQEKRVCSSWNGGNAIIGLQNATGTQGVFAPNRNGLDPDWTAFNEAWRFVPSGTSITTIKWHEGPLSGPIVGTTPTINVCPSSTTTYTAEVSYALCNGSVLTEIDETTVTVNGTKTWNGSVDTNWEIAANWTPVGVPNSGDCVVIPMTANQPILNTGALGYAGTLTVLNGAVLTTLPQSVLTVTNLVTVEPTGTFTIENTSSLIQIDDVVNIGSIQYHRDTTIRKFDYVYWSAPVSNFNISQLAAPLINGPVFKWNTTIANTNGGQGNWQVADTDVMTAGKGYIVRGPDSFTNTAASPFTGLFTGVPNNGTLLVPVQRGTDTNALFHAGVNGTEITNMTDNMNLLGNPYPSAVSGSQFLFANAFTIHGSIALWSHQTLPTSLISPFYGTFAYNYTPNDYITYNFTGTSCCPAAGADLSIGAGQGFMVQMLDGPAGSDVVEFNNTMRNAQLNNTAFYRAAQPNTITQLERHRYWLDIIGPTGATDRTLIGYVQNATMQADHFFDNRIAVMSQIQLFSKIDQDKYNIQGRALPFQVDDEVPLGVHLPEQGLYRIGIAATDGHFNQQAIYLKDNLLGVYHDLKANPYQFTASPGAQLDRFSIVYQTQALEQPNWEWESTVSVVTQQQLAVHSAQLPIAEVTVYDLVGRLVDVYSHTGMEPVVLHRLLPQHAGWILKIKLDNGTIVYRKALY